MKHVECFNPYRIIIKILRIQIILGNGDIMLRIFKVGFEYREQNNLIEDNLDL